MHCCITSCLTEGWQWHSQTIEITLLCGKQTQMHLSSVLWCNWKHSVLCVLHTNVCQLWRRYTQSSILRSLQQYLSIFATHLQESKQWRTRKLFMGGFIQRHRVVICIWCALFVTSQNDVIVLFPNQRFGEVCWHNMHIFLYIHSSYFMCQCTEYKLLELQVRLSEENTYTQRYDTAVRNCKKYQAAR